MKLFISKLLEANYIFWRVIKGKDYIYSDDKETFIYGTKDFIATCVDDIIDTTNRAIDQRNNEVESDNFVEEIKNIIK